MRCSPYVEWYQNSLAIEGSPVAGPPRASTTATCPTTRSSTQFLAGHAGWQPEPWADLFAGGRRALRRARHQAPRRRAPLAERHAQPAQGAVGVRARPRRRPRRRGARPGLRFGTYYSGGLDWTFGGLPITRPGRRCSRRSRSRAEYLDYADAHWHELIDRYRPDVLWNDIGYPAAADLDRLFERLLRGGARRRREQPLRLDGASRPGCVHCDFVTPEYSTKGDPNRKWEATRGHRHVVRVQPRRRTTTATCRPTRSCGCSSTSWPTAATCSSTSVPPATAPSRGCRPSASSPSAGGCAPTAPPSTAPARGRAPRAPPARATTCASPRGRRGAVHAIVLGTPGVGRGRAASTCTVAAGGTVELLGHDGPLPTRARGRGHGRGAARSSRADAALALRIARH